MSREELQKLYHAKSGGIIQWDILKKADAPMQVSQRGHYALAVIEEILYRHPESPVYNDQVNLLSAASAYANAGETDTAIKLLEEHAEKHPKLREYAQKTRDELNSEHQSHHKL